tara:strand:- start:1196 stop:2695 length:1500 start_codon:yes stop_codon:yes gene_type:complete
VFLNQESGSENIYDAVLIGAGVMSSTLAALLNELEPQMRILIVERLSEPGLESSFALNNAGTGHAANCELNYTPMNSDGSINIEKALEINSAFEKSLEFWASLVANGKLSSRQFLNYLPHISFVWGESNVAFLRKRYEKLFEIDSFKDIEWSSEIKQLQEWMPLIFQGRNINEPMAATRIKRGTDLDFGALSAAYLENLNKSKSIEIELSTEVVDLRKESKNYWVVNLQGEAKSKEVKTAFVFIGAGGAALTLLQKSGIAEGLLYGGFPVSGQWLICNEPSMANKHMAKVYGRPKLGSPPMSVPHLDTRWIQGKRSLLFGPFAGFSTRFLKEGSYWDLIESVNRNNILPMLQVGIKNFDLVNYLLGQVRLDHKARIQVLRDFVPTARESDWKLCQAGQRVQIIKNSSKGPVLKMGTEVVSSSDGSLAALLGASPGASTAVTTMLEVIRRCWSARMATDAWKEKLLNLFPSFAETIQPDIAFLKKIRDRNDSILGFTKSC